MCTSSSMKTKQNIESDSSSYMKDLLNSDDQENINEIIEYVLPKILFIRKINL